MTTYPRIKASEFIRQLRTHLGQFYVYGWIGRSGPVTISGLQAKEKQYGKKMGNGYYQLNGDFTKGKCAKAIGHPATDCSGLERWAYWELTDVDFSKSADGMYRWCNRHGKIDTMPKQGGVLLFKLNSTGTAYHTGIYTGDGLVIQAGSVDYGIKEELIKKGWTHWGIWDLMDMDVPVDGSSAVDDDENPEGDATTGKPDDDFDPNHVPYLDKGDKGNLVAYMQHLLALKGYKLPKSVKPSNKYGYDGDWGDETEEVFAQFQRDNKAKVKHLDTVCGPLCWTELTGIPCK